MILIIDPDQSVRARIAERLPKGMPSQDAVSIADGDPARSDGAEVVLVGPGIPTAETFALAEALRTERPAISVVLIADEIGIPEMQAALVAGVRDVWPMTFTAEQAQASLDRIEKLGAHLRGPDGGGDGTEHRVITVFSSKGGVGKSFIAANLAMALARKGAPVALVDLDLQFGDLAIMLQLFPARTIHDAATTTSDLDADALEGYLAEHRGGVKLLAAPFEPGLAETVAPDAVGHILRVLKRTFTYVVVDTPAALNEHVIAAIDQSERTVLVGSMDVPSIKNMKLALQTLTLLDVPRERIHLVLNRADSEVGLRLGEVERTLGTRVEVSIPSGREVPLSINRGVPLMLEMSNSPVTAALQKLTALVTGNDEPALVDARKEGGWLRRKAR
jgi:pilus assembly protein CpaE